MDAASDFGPEEEAMQAYFRDGEARALALGNRGPLRFTAAGKLHPDILDAYMTHGFYVLEGVITPAELAELKAEILDMIDRLPAARGAAIDRKGRPALGTDRGMTVAGWSKPLGDPMGGTGMVNGRAPVKMYEPKPADGLPDEIAYAISGPLQFSDAALRLYGHPKLLAVAASINGEDFAPFNETIIIKKPGEGASFAWHRDGTTHWNDPAWNATTHGFNFMAQLFDCKAASAVWFLPGSHAKNKVDIKGLLEEAGSDRMPGAVPLICKAGDIALSNRQIVHGSFANTSPDWRVTMNFGFHQRKWVADVHVHGMKSTLERYDAERLRKRSEIIGYAIDARRKRFPEETPYRYQPHAADGASFDWGEAARAKISAYNKLDIFI